MPLALAPEIDKFVADLPPKRAYQQRSVLRRYIAWLDGYKLEELSERTAEAWVGMQKAAWSPMTQRLYRGVVRRFVAMVAPKSPSPEPAHIDPPRIRLRTPEERAAIEAKHRAAAEASAERRRKEIEAKRAARREGRAARQPAKTSPPTPTPKTKSPRSLDVDALADKIAERLSQRLDAAPEQRSNAREAPLDLLRHQLTVLVDALGAECVADMLDVAPSGLVLLARNGKVPRVPDVVELDTAYVRLRWLQRDLAEDDELEDMKQRLEGGRPCRVRSTRRG